MNNLIYLPSAPSPLDDLRLNDVARAAMALVDAISEFNQARLGYEEIFDLTEELLAEQLGHFQKMSDPRPTSHSEHTRNH